MGNSEEKQQSDNSRGDEKPPELFESHELFGNRSEIMIRHEGQLYRIRITRNGKLVMNK